ncbi:LacI family transcriptional regulator [Nonomuraea sp. MG754425]|uniref:LacI family DNA-binding transcriptional regulator n=1 Tax=Nonomuraea sp. MG754425 TaxID=2570319 RepID=UPI001F1A0B41|nr:LacI family DNA-binding transcriptional regulator [Nonomuraea sp. MG754425]MCF6475440.1 LacI family transcriptional regulator [Nonomuraea sp. MG754425]
MREDLPPSSPTLEDVARAAGVSRATVSRVINGIRNVDSTIQEAVRQAVAATGYVPNRAARSLVTRRTGGIALVVSGAGGEDGHFPVQVFTDPFFGRVVAGIVGFLRPRGIHPVLMFAETAEARAQVLASLRQGDADGAVLVSTHSEDPLPELLAEARLPAVLFARPARPVPISYVDVDHQAGAKLAADHLVARGRSRIVTISGPLDVPAGQARLTGFRDAMAAHGHPFVPCAEGGFTAHSGEEAMERLLAEHPALDGVFAANDLMAQGALLALRHHGRGVPDDVAVVGFDDSSAAAACRPALTTVRHPVEDMAAEMARLLLRHIEQPGHRPTSIIFEPALVVRDSS